VSRDTSKQYTLSTTVQTNLAKVQQLCVLGQTKNFQRCVQWIHAHLQK